MCGLVDINCVASAMSRWAPLDCVMLEGLLVPRTCAAVHCLHNPLVMPRQVGRSPPTVLQRIATLVPPGHVSPLTWPGQRLGMRCHWKEVVLWQVWQVVPQPSQELVAAHAGQKQRDSHRQDMAQDSRQAKQQHAADEDVVRASYTSGVDTRHSASAAHGRMLS